VLDLPMHLPKAGEFGAALGAARLAMAADGQGAADQLMTPPEVAEVIAPRNDLRDQYEARYQTYRALYPAIKGAVA
jgi:xylulokinase